MWCRNSSSDIPESAAFLVVNQEIPEKLRLSRDRMTRLAPYRWYQVPSAEFWWWIVPGSLYLTSVSVKLKGRRPDKLLRISMQVPQNGATRPRKNTFLPWKCEKCLESCIAIALEVSLTSCKFFLCNSFTQPAL